MVVVAIATAMTVATMAMQWHDCNATATVMGGNGQCNRYAPETTVMEGVATMQRQHGSDGRHNRNGDKWNNGNVITMTTMESTTEMATGTVAATGTETATATATAMEGRLSIAVAT